MRVTLDVRSRDGVLAALVLLGAWAACHKGTSDGETAPGNGGATGRGGVSTDAPNGTGGSATGGTASDARPSNGGAGSGGARSGGGAGGAATGATSGSLGAGGQTLGGAGAGGSATGVSGVDASIPTDGRTIGTDGATASQGGRSGDGAVSTGGAPSDTGGTGSTTPWTVKLFDQLPQFGIYATSNPKNYTPPSGMLMWSVGTVIVTKLTDTDKARMRSKLVARLTYHAQCDNYDRLGSLFFIVKPPGQSPVERDPRIEIVRYITPFSDYTRGELATYVYPDADVSPYAATLADPGQDAWLGIVSGANPYDGDPCTNAQVTPEFRQVGYKISAELVTSGAALAGPGMTLSAKSYKSETKLPISGTFENAGGTVSGSVTVIVSGHGSDSGGNEYMHTDDVVRVNDVSIGTFGTQVDCASYARYSPDGNPGIFRNNGSSNPRNWCPGALVAPHSYPATLNAGSNTVTLSISPANVPSGSYYATTINFTSP